MRLIIVVHFTRAPFICRNWYSKNTTRQKTDRERETTADSI